MDFEKYYNIKSDGSYSIHFANNNGYSNSEIEVIFSNYGNILSLDASGGDQGLRFIRYRTLDEVKKCLQDLRDNKFIRILPQKNKIQQKYKKETSSEPYQSKNKDIKLTNNSSGMNFKRNENGGNSNSYSTDQDKFGNTFKESQNNDTMSSDQFSDVSSNASTEGKRFNKKQNFKEKACMSRMKKTSSQSLECKGSAATIVSTNSSIIQNSIANMRLNDDIPNLIKEEKYSQDKSLTQCSTPVLPKTGTILAQDVIVGNIHKDFGIHYILHLLESYDPVSVSLMKIVPNSNIRYCHVYFKTPQDALAVEQKFDKYNLSGKHLIVLRCLKLIEEATGL